MRYVTCVKLARVKWLISTAKVVWKCYLYLVKQLVSSSSFLQGSNLAIQRYPIFGDIGFFFHQQSLDTNPINRNISN